MASFDRSAATGATLVNKLKKREINVNKLPVNRFLVTNINAGN